MIYIVENKLEQIKNVIPNVFHNIFDIKYDNNYELLNCNGELIPIHINNYSCHIGLYNKKISNKSFKELKKYIFKNYCNVEQLHVFFTHTKDLSLKESIHWHIDLPNTIEEFDKKLSSKTRYNTKWYPKQIRQYLGDYVIEVLEEKECPEELILQYLKWKQQTHSYIWEDTPRAYFKWAGVTHVYVMKIKNKPIAIGQVCITDNNAFFENFSYEPIYSKYSLGMVLYHFIIEDLIKRKIKRFYLLGGQYEYKRRFNGIKTIAYTGTINKKSNFIPKLIKIANFFELYLNDCI